jgi:zinc/manganese transport system substrate-binding protein
MSAASRHGRGTRMPAALLALVAAVALAASACGASSASNDGRRRIVVTYSVLGAVVKDLVGDTADVTVLMPNGSDPHQWSPSARDIETLVHADLLVENGLNLEGGMSNAFAQAQGAGVRRFVATDHVTVRHVAAGQATSTADPDQAVGAADPHIWMDPLTIRQLVGPLSDQVRSDLGLDLSARVAGLESRLAALSSEIEGTLSAIPSSARKLVTGHESLGYFADRYGFTLIGAIVPSLSDQAETSSADLAALEAQIRAAGVKAIFTELGTSAATAQAVGRDTGAKVVELSTHTLPADGSYFTFMRQLASVVAGSLA